MLLHSYQRWSLNTMFGHRYTHRCAIKYLIYKRGKKEKANITKWPRKEKIVGYFQGCCVMTYLYLPRYRMNNSNCNIWSLVISILYFLRIKAKFSLCIWTHHYISIRASGTVNIWPIYACECILRVSAIIDYFEH